MRRMRIPIPATLALLLAAPACVPFVTHGPRVQPGLTTGVVASIGTQPALERELDHGGGSVTPLYPPAGFFAQAGWTPAEHGIGLPVSAGVMLPLGLPFSVLHPQGDLYLQLLSTPTGVAGGAGVLASPSSVTPYAQLGREVADELTVYTTQSLAYFHGGRGPRGTVWMPAVAVKARGMHVWAQGGLGRERLRDASGAPASRPVRFGMGGITVEAPVPRLRPAW